MNCHYCDIAIHSKWKNIGSIRAAANDKNFSVVSGIPNNWSVEALECPACWRTMFRINHPKGARPYEVAFIYPLRPERRVNEAVIEPYRSEYLEASAALSVSLKASAALSRRCLQTLLRQKGGFEQKDLIDQIDAAVNSHNFSSDLAASMDAIRHVGNFAAHPVKNKNTGEITEVEPGEAEWLLETLEQLFDHYFVKPKQLADRQAALNAKLKAAGKPEIKR